MLASPTKDEIDQLRKTAAIMTEDEIKNADSLTDEQVKKIAQDAGVDPALLAIFINGYILHCKRVS